MEELKNQIININVTDGSLPAGPGVPDTGNHIANSIFSAMPDNTIWVIGLILLATVVIVMWLLKSRHARKALFTIPAMVLALMVFSPLILQASVTVPLPSDEISITVDKNKSLSSTAPTNILLEQDASDYAEISANLTNDLGGLVGEDVFIAVQPSSGSYTDLTTTNQVITQINEVVAPMNIPMNVRVTIDENLPVGSYNVEINYYGRFVQLPAQATMTFTCDSNIVFPPTVDATSFSVASFTVNPIDDLTTELTLNVGDTLTLPSPDEIGLDCSEIEGDYWEAYYLAEWGYDYYHSYNIDDSTGITEPPFFMLPGPSPSSQPWYEECWIDWQPICTEYEDAINEWYEGVYEPWLDAWYEAWYEYEDQYLFGGETAPLVNGLVLVWRHHPIAV